MFNRLDRIQSRAVNIAKRATFSIRRNANEALRSNRIFTVGIEVEAIHAIYAESIVESYIAGLLILQQIT